MESDEGLAQMADLKGSYEKAEQEYKQHKECINTIAEEADSVKVILKERPSVRTFVFQLLNSWLIRYQVNQMK